MKIELTHDLIAKKVREAVSAQDRSRLHAQHIVRVRHELYLTTPELLLTGEELTFIQPYKSGLLLSDSEQNFLSRSEKEVAARLRWVYLRNFLNIAFVLGTIFTILGLREYRRAERSVYQNQQLATDLIKISADVRRIKTVKDLQVLQDKIADLRATKLTDEQLTEWMRSAKSDSLLKLLDDNPPNSESFAASLRPVLVAGKIDFEQKGKNKYKAGGFPQAEIDVLGMKALSDKADGSFRFYVLTDPALLPPHFNISIQAEGYARYTEAITPAKEANGKVYFPIQEIKMQLE
jgi:hypothetical protein